MGTSHLSAAGAAESSLFEECVAAKARCIENSRSPRSFLGCFIGGQAIALSGLIGFLVAWLLCYRISLEACHWLPVFLGFTGIPMAVLTFLGNESGECIARNRIPENLAGLHSRCWVKYSALLATLLILGLCYSILPIYRSAFYVQVWRLAPGVLVSVALLAYPYFLLVDPRMENPKDGYWQFGALLHGRFGSIDWLLLKTYLLGWLVKGFFLPYMLAGAIIQLSLLQRFGFNWYSFRDLYSTSLILLYAFDVIFGALGYLLTLRMLGTQIKSVESTLFGWGVTIWCYPPFSIWSGKILPYRGNLGWQEWLADWPILYISWGFCIIVLTAIYAWATCSFGCRFSNLTNRGVITDGPYAILRHPAYFCKNLAWWLMFVPFVAHSTWSANLRAALCLLVINFIYYCRAKTEERHLKKDPAYLAYWEWMEANGLWGQVKQMGVLRRRKGSVV